MNASDATRIKALAKQNGAVRTLTQRVDVNGKPTDEVERVLCYLPKCRSAERESFRATLRDAGWLTHVEPSTSTGTCIAVTGPRSSAGQANRGDRER